MNKKEKLIAMGSAVRVTKELVRQYNPDTNVVSWKEIGAIRYGWVVGFRTVYNGIYYNGGMYEQSELIKRTGIHHALVSINPMAKPIRVPLDALIFTGLHPDGKGGLRVV